jgi:hypothetical protein
MRQTEYTEALPSQQKIWGIKSKEFEKPHEQSTLRHGRKDHREPGKTVRPALFEIKLSVIDQRNLLPILHASSRRLEQFM